MKDRLDTSHKRRDDRRSETLSHRQHLAMPALFTQWCTTPSSVLAVRASAATCSGDDTSQEMAYTYPRANAPDIHKLRAGALNLYACVSVCSDWREGRRGGMLQRETMPELRGSSKPVRPCQTPPGVPL